jgi:hypothetical protein
VRSERLLVDQIRMNLLYRWFIDLSLDAPVWSATSFTKNRERFEKHGLLRKFFDKVVAQALVEEWANEEHFTVDGTLIQSYASQKSLRPIETGSTATDPTTMIRAIRRSISGASGARTGRTVRSPIPRRAWLARLRGRKASSRMACTS